MNPEDKQIGKPVEKKPYVKPQVIYREKLEAMASVCNNTTIAKQTNFDCPIPPKQTHMS